MLIALLRESELRLADETIEMILDNVSLTFVIFSFMFFNLFDL